ncbi:hypothetical protein QOZ80_7BG0600390 [Eleusine coracana subsp. coracana]|nr:hypothetical protein QOZ80_7BG0600390 [Eleusine coracana subsp. coracana]
MAKKILLLTILFAVALAEEADPMPKEWTTAKKSIRDMDEKTQKAFDEVNTAVRDATMMQVLNVQIALTKAKDAADENKVVSIARSYEIAADKVIAAPPAEKFKTMEDTFNAVVV